MTQQSGYSSPSTTKHHHDQSTSLTVANRILTYVKNRWDKGEEADVANLLNRYPELKIHKSFVLSLAHEEYCRRLESGEQIDADDFCGRFPSFKNSLYMVIELNRLLGKDPEFQALCSEPQWPEPEECFLGYKLIVELGRGSFARVFLASEPALGGRLVVLKVAPRGGEEAEVVGKLQHPNIVPVHSIKEDPITGLTAICMPYMGRTTFCDVLDRAFSNGASPIKPDAIWQAITELHEDPKLLEAPGFDAAMQRGSYVEAIIHLAIQVVDALSYTHARGICHLDLKPSNVLLSIEGRPLLLDFNLSAEGEMDAWKIGGTLPYMSPEQLRSVIYHGRRPHSYPDPRSDLFSFGIIVYQLLSGDLPFGPVPRESSAEEIAEKLLRRQEQGPLSLREKNPQVDRQLAAIVENCLAFEPEERPQSAQVLAKTLCKQITPIRRSQRWAKNHPRTVSVAVGAVLAIVCSIGLFLALRPLYSVRQFRQGQYYAERGQFHLAVKCLDRSIEANSSDLEALFARGRVRQKLGQYDLAAADFRQALKIKSDADLYACQGFCANKLDYNKSAKVYYQKALDAGFQSPGLFNNLGYTCYKLNMFDNAAWYLKKAIEMDPKLQAAHNNLLLLHLQQADHGMPVTESILLHAKHAAKTAPPSGELYHRVASLFAIAGQQDSHWIPLAKEYARKAVDHHLNPKKLASAPGFFALCEDPEVKVILNRPAPKQPSVRPVLLVDPLDNCQSVTAAHAVN